MRYRLVLRLTAADVGQRVVIRWRPGDSEQLTEPAAGLRREQPGRIGG